MAQLLGHEMLGAAKYKKFAIKSLPAGRCGKVFANTFGDGLPVIIGWAKKGVHPVLMEQATWAGSSHDYSDSKYLKTAIKELKRFSNVAKDFPHLEFRFSPYCEHNESVSFMLKTFQELLPYADKVTLVNTPNMNGVLVSGFRDEVHGTYHPLGLQQPYDWACDGMSAYDCDIKKWIQTHTKADIIWGWIPQYNCKKNTKDDTAIKDRKVKPVEKQVISLDYVLVEEKGLCNLDGDSIWKSHADQHYPKPSPREQKPVLITLIRGDEAILTAKNGKKVYTLERKGNYTDGRPLYRADDWGYEIAKKAIKVSGSPVVMVTIGDTKIGTVNPAFRQNAYRND